MMQDILFKDFIQLQRGFDLPKYQRKDGGVPVIGATRQQGFHNVVKVSAPGVTTGRSGALGEVLLIQTAFWPLNTCLWVKNFKGNDPRYVYYRLKTLGLEHFNSGAGVPTLNRNHLDTLPLNIHSYEEQKGIAQILGAYDDLIENNLKRIAILDRMAEQLFSYFLEVHQDGVTNVKIGDILLSLEAGKRPRGGIADIKEGIPSIGAENIKGIGYHDYDSEKLVPKDFYNSMRKGRIINGDVAIYKDGAYIGRSSYFIDDFPHNKACVNEHVFLLRGNPDIIPHSVLYLTVRNKSVNARVRATNSNSAQPGINQEKLKNVEVPLLTSESNKVLDQVASTLFSMIVNLAKQNKKLAESRDLLLPLLMSGEVEV